MNNVIAMSQAVSGKFLRFSLAFVLFWIGALKFADPSPVVGLLNAAVPFLAFTGVVYCLGVVEIIAAIFLVAGIAVRYVGVALVGLFAGTILIFLIAPAVAYGDNGFPFLSLAGEFLLKDFVLMAAAVSLIAMDPGKD